MQKFSSAVQSSQTEIHHKLNEVLAKRVAHADRTPIAAHSIAHWPALQARLVQPLPLIVDMGCGTGDSTSALARRYPGRLVLGVDRSADRLSKNLALPDNAYRLRFDQHDLVRLLTQHAIPISKCYLLYPNPSPKPELLMRRWHAHPVFPALLAITQQLELRTNWQIYADEFATALRYFHWSACKQLLGADEPAISPFEAKYQASGHALYQVLASRS